MTTGPIDVCKTPTPGGPVPMPYPNIAQVNGADKTAKKVLAEKKDLVCQNSKVKRSNGDEPGVAKGLVSNKNMDQCTFKKYSSKVYAQGKKVVHLTAVTGQNGSMQNTVGIHGVPSQTKVIVAL